MPRGVLYLLCSFDLAALLSLAGNLLLPSYARTRHGLRHTWLASNEADISVLGESGPSAAAASVGIDGVWLNPAWDRQINACFVSADQKLHFALSTACQRYAGGLPGVRVNPYRPSHHATASIAWKGRRLRERSYFKHHLPRMRQ